MARKPIGVSLESTNQEIEYVFIAEIKDLKELNKADSITIIENWEFKSIEPIVRPGALWGSIRARSYDNKMFTFTVKVDENHYGNKSGPSVVEEHEIQITKDMFVTFKKLAPYGTIVHRHKFKTDGGLTWEFDIYLDEHGKPRNWCKIDLEVPNASTQLPDFPIALNEVIPRNRTPEQIEFVKDLYQNKFNIFQQNSIMPIKWVDDK